jgi:hypothetical protein
MKLSDRKIRFVFLMFLCMHLSAQKISRPELRWAFFHPVAAIKVKCISKKCKRIYEEKAKSNNSALDQFSSGGKLDAFRHVFYMSAFARKVKVKKLRKLGMAHEKGDYRAFLKSKREFGELPDSVATEMDLANNEIGFQIGIKNRKVKLDKLLDAASEAITGGKAVIMKRNAQGKYLDCEGKILDIEKYHGQWNIPKCLVSSDFVYSANTN